MDEIKKTAPVSANRTQSVLVTLLNWAADGELIDANPIARMKKRAKEVAKDRTLTDDEIRVLWPALAGSSAISFDVAASLRLMLLTGQRPGEIAGLLRSEVRDVERPEAARLEISAARMKGGRAHVVPLGAMARAVVGEALARRKKDAEPRRDHREVAAEPAIAVFASRFASRDTLARHSLSQGLRRCLVGLNAAESDWPTAVRSLQASPPTPHDFRRTVATGMARLGVPREDRKAVLAHAEDDVHGLPYDRHKRLAEKRAALDLWERHLRPLSGEVAK